VSITTARLQLVDAQPFYAAILQNCLFSWNEQIGTAAVGLDPKGYIHLLVSPTFWDSLTEEHRVGLLMHEMLHLSLDHFGRGVDLDKKLANIAQDIALNQYIPIALLPTGGLLPEKFGFSNGLSFEQYYLKLLESKSTASNLEPLDNHEGIPGLCEISGQAGDGQGENPSDLKGEIMRATVSDVLKKAAKAVGRGNVPSHFKERLDHIEKQDAKGQWKTILKRYMGRHLSSEIESTRSRPNRRMGLRSPGNRRLDEPKILIAIDESGSMGHDQILEVTAEIKSILKNLSEKTEVVHFDTSIAHVEKLTRITEVVRHAFGGTSFNCVIEHARKVRPDLLVILTDGEGDLTEKPTCPIMWVLTKGSRQIKYAGEKVYL
jgi:predicted metal-dependent peptidase